MNRNELETIVQSAISLLIKDHAFLLFNNVSERALTHHLANCIAIHLPPKEYDVDIEYNRHFENSKRIFLVNLPERATSDREPEAITVFPDIILHRRNSDDHNLLVIEVKKSEADLNYDKHKLCAFRKQLGYHNAAHVILGRDAADKIIRKVIWVDPL